MNYCVNCLQKKAQQTINQTIPPLPSVHFKTNQIIPKWRLKTDNIAVFDFETLGSQKGEFWTPTQIAVESLNDDKKSYSKFVKMDTKSATAINNALNTIKNGKTQELKPEIVRSLLWLADIDVDKET